MRNAVYLSFVFSCVLHVTLFVAGNRNQEESIAFKKGAGAIEVSSAPKKATTNGKGAIASAVSHDEVAPDVGVLDGGSSLGIAPPEYPKLSRIRGEQGEVLLHLKLNRADELIAVDVAKSSGHSALDAASTAAIKNGLRPAGDTAITREPKIRFRFELKSPVVRE